MTNSSPPDPQGVGQIFALFNEIGIIGQLSRTLFEARLEPGMTIHQFSVLNHLMRVGEGTTPQRMATAFQVPKTSMSHTVAGLVKRGYVTLEPSPTDGRSKCVFTTEAGRACRDRAIAALAPDIAELAPQLPEGLVEALLPHLVTLREVMDAARD
ncbi:MarR family winged helix-turn-helix transcriptional regulator [Pontivivens insulae]|uniref:HTH marR-type domain-containing protein n=1 Tax=Pontivivens insulae TaxID=1639689 RepID=A0A2R8AEQ9_9RHOB|nr:MarR family winged helix-turn-helix transcriptional regulator [Pontivivens insulae]RED11831.1 MarR family transcriptional regulator [Pontivivens insulae]SPF30588.1 hypothetical protein POI8812_02927 [Pontivivens insulae]